MLNGRPQLPTRTGPRTNSKRAHGAATLPHGPFQRFVRQQPFHSRIPNQITTSVLAETTGVSTLSQNVETSILAARS